jgi:hypothetical protein
MTSESEPSTTRSRAILGFLERRGREDRFATGFHDMLHWLQTAPQVAHRVGPELSRAGCAASARKLRRPAPGGMRSVRLSRSTRTQLSLLAARVAAIAADDYRAVKRKPRAVRKSRTLR